ncbi:MAG: hypothetical protein ISS70_10980 [Phycisphaerae bacterium]|nr:hypothetical protein [Phycisphaerae bacterium]
MFGYWLVVVAIISLHKAGEQAVNPLDLFYLLPDLILKPRILLHKLIQVWLLALQSSVNKLLDSLVNNTLSVVLS